MNVPFNNGKIEMGKYYQRPKYVEHDTDMLLLQEALVGDTKAIRLKKLLNAVYVAVVVLALFGVFLFH